MRDITLIQTTVTFLQDLILHTKNKNLKWQAQHQPISLYGLGEIKPGNSYTLEPGVSYGFKNEYILNRFKCVFEDKIDIEIKFERNHQSIKITDRLINPGLASSQESISYPVYYVPIEVLTIAEVQTELEILYDTITRGNQGESPLYDNQKDEIGQIMQSLISKFNDIDISHMEPVDLDNPLFKNLGKVIVKDGQ